MFLVFMAIPVVLDTNFMLLPFQRKLDIEGEVERLVEAPHFFVVLQQAVDELTEMARQKRSFSPAARAALIFIQRKVTVEKGTLGKPDAAMLEYCKANGGILATFDAALRRKARGLDVRVVFLRDKGHLALS